ncbi:MAG: DUF2911 domain-containing protein [Cyclobacteriaceae bacterium]|nr:DUF2911 domain-containing protein [Cyclobacteriaceae bacterium]
MKRVLILLLVAVSLASQAQVVTPAASPAATVSTVVGLTEVKVEYSRPKMKGRKIFGTGADFVTPYGQMWRTGANAGTIVTFADDVKFAGTDVPKGKYLLLTIPGAAEWTVILYKDVALGGNMSGYDQKNDQARAVVKPETLSHAVEAFTIEIADLSADSKAANLQLMWEKTSVKVPFTVDFDKKVMASIEANTKVSPGNLYAAASYYLETGKDLKVALDWCSQAAAARPQAYWIMHTKAKIQQGLGDKKGAMESAMASKAEAEKQNDGSYVRMNDELIKALK